VARIWLPLPDRDFDVTEVAVPWRLLTNAGHTVGFATEAGAPAACDPLLLTDVVFGQLGAEPEPKRFYGEMIASPEFTAPVAAICHGVLVAARAGVLAGVRTSCLPKYMELTAWSLTAWKHGNYYRTYPETVQDEVVRRGGVFVRGPIELLRRGTAEDDGPAFVVEDGRYLSARWPGDAYLLARRLLARLPGQRTASSTS
jgi:putative intracellular protease/amidase